MAELKMKQPTFPLDPIDEQKEQKINAVVVTPPTRDYLKGPNLPNMDLLTGPRENYLEIGVPLYEASIKCNWKAAKDIIEKYPKLDLVRYSITENGETALHIAASANVPGKVKEFVKNLVTLMKEEDLALENKNYNTALYLAAAAGNINPVKIMLEKNKMLLSIPGGPAAVNKIPTKMPIYVAALFGNHNVVKYLYEKSNDLIDDPWTPGTRGGLLEECVENDMFDVALKIVKKYPELGTGSVLTILARKPEAFREPEFNSIQCSFSWVIVYIASKVLLPEKNDEALQLLSIIWNNIAKKPKNEIDDIIRGPSCVRIHSEKGLIASTSESQTKIIYPSRILFVAAKMGNTKFLVELIRLYPDLIWNVDDKNRSIFHIAVKHRHEGIYNLLYEIGSMKNLITSIKDVHGNNMLHLVGKSASRKRRHKSGVALQMQRELLWYLEVAVMIPPSYIDRKNNAGQTPYELFTLEHKELVKLDERWMKETVSQCMVVAALIATIVFAAAFTVPGGYDQNNGTPIFHSEATFMVFVVADAISLFSSTTSLLIFLSILASRYTERDFLVSLPRRLMAGLATLFLSITTMTVAFSVSFFVLYHKGQIWMPILIGAFAVMPVLYIKQQYALFFDVIRSTYGSRHLFKPTKHVLYYENPKV